MSFDTVIVLRNEEELRTTLLRLERIIENERKLRLELENELRKPINYHGWREATKTGVDVEPLHAKINELQRRVYVKEAKIQELIEEIEKLQLQLKSKDDMIERKVNAARTEEKWFRRCKALETEVRILKDRIVELSLPKFTLHK